MKKYTILIYALACLLAHFEGHGQSTNSAGTPLNYPYVVNRSTISTTGKNREAYRNYFIRVKETSGDTNIYFVDYRGMGQKVSGAGGGGAAADKDWLKVRDNGTPYNVTDTIYTKKYAGIGQRYFWQGARLAAMDSAARSVIIAAGDRSAALGLYCYNTGYHATVEQNGNGTAVTMQPGGEFVVGTAGSGTVTNPLGPFYHLLEISSIDTSITIPFLPNSRSDAGDPGNFLFSNNSGTLKSKDINYLDERVAVAVSAPLAGSGLSADPIYISGSGGSAGDVMQLDGGGTPYFGPLDIPTSEQVCVDTVYGTISNAVIGTPLVRVAPGVWGNIAEYPTTTIPTAVVVWRSATLDTFIIAYCGRFNVGMTPGAYYADSTGMTGPGYTTTVPTGYQRPAYIVDASGYLTPTLNLSFAPAPPASVISSLPLQGTGTTGDPLTLSTAGASIGDVYYFDGTEWNLGQGLDIQSLFFVNPNLTISGANTVNLSGINYLTKTGSDLSYTAGAISVGVASTAARFVVQGAGATSATKTAQFQNSAGTQVLNIWDDSAVSVGAGTPSSVSKFQVILDAATKTTYRVSSPSGNLFSIRQDGPMFIGDDNAGFGSKSSEFVYNTIAQYFVFSASNTAATSDQGTGGQFWMIGRGGTGTTGKTNLMALNMGSSSFAPTSGSKEFNALLINPIINQTGATGMICGIKYDPTLTSVSGGNNFLLQVPQTTKNGFGTTTPTSTIDLNPINGYNQLRLRTQYTPTSSADANGSAGDISVDDNFIYFKTSTGWKRAALSTF